MTFFKLFFTSKRAQVEADIHDFRPNGVLETFDQRIYTYLSIRLFMQIAETLDIG